MSEEEKKTYYCTQCKGDHKVGSNIGIRHRKYEGERPIDETVEPVDEVVKPESGIGRLKMGAPTGSPPEASGLPKLEAVVKTEEKVEEAPDPPCGHLFWDTGRGCDNCQGFRCSASGDKKVDKSLAEELCKTEDYKGCKIFLEARKTGAPVRCPYQGPPPADEATCSGLWCYAENRPIRVPKSCIKWARNCGAVGRARFAGKPFYRQTIPQDPEPEPEVEPESEEVVE